MHEPQKDVLQFHAVMGLRLPMGPSFDWDDMKHLRLDLIKEEVQELDDAIHDRDVLEMIDALCDLLYVTYGFAVSQGIDLEPFWAEVQKANLAKVYGPKRADGKQLKPEGWEPPNHSKVWQLIYGGEM